MAKNYQKENVHQAVQERLAFIFKNFKNVIVSFSGGKDSSVLLNLTYEYAKRTNQLSKLAFYYMDYEAGYEDTDKFITRSFSRYPEINRKYWLCLPISAQCSVSMHQTYWIPWDKAKQAIWVKPMPKSPYVVNEDNVSYPFKHGTYGADARKQFVQEFAAKYGKTAVLVGIRADESLSRLGIITSQHRRETFQDKRYSKQQSALVYNFYPIYDWKTEDIWTANAKFGWDYNKVYDLMYYAGLSISEMRIASPFHSSGQNNLKLYRALSPNTWGKMVSRVNGVNFTAIYGGTAAMAYKTIKKPDNLTWKEYAQFLIATLPKDTQAYFLKNLKRIEDSWKNEGYGRNPDVIRTMENEGVELEHTGKESDLCTKPKYYEIVKIKNGIPDESSISSFRHVPSWKGVCVTILKNDFTMQYMGVSRSKHMMARRRAAIKEYQNIL